MQSTQSVSSGSSRSGSPPNRNSTSAGFSLIEVLATLLVTMLLIMSLGPFVSQMFATWSRGSEAAGLVELKTRGINQLRKDLRHAIVWTGYGKLEDLAAFEGNETSLSFPVVAGPGPSGLGIEYLSFTVAKSPDGWALVRKRAPMIGSSYGSFVDPVVLLSGQFKYVFKYCAHEGEALPVWNKGRLDLPSRVELAVADRSGRQIFKLPISIPTFASMSAGCIVSNSLQGCPAIEVSIDEALKNSTNLAPGVLQGLLSPGGKS
jgi:hypothetical protein